MLCPDLKVSLAELVLVLERVLMLVMVVDRMVVTSSVMNTKVKRIVVVVTNGRGCLK